MTESTVVTLMAQHSEVGLSFNVRQSRNLCEMEVAFWREMAQVIARRGGKIWLWLLNANVAFDVRIAAMIRLAHHTDKSMGTAPFTTRDERVMFCDLLAEEAQDEANGDYDAPDPLTAAERAMGVDNGLR